METSAHELSKRLQMLPEKVHYSTKRKNLKEYYNVVQERAVDALHSQGSQRIVKFQIQTLCVVR
jgi:hypothetical protein